MKQRKEGGRKGGREGGREGGKEGGRLGWEGGTGEPLHYEHFWDNCPD